MEPVPLDSDTVDSSSLTDDELRAAWIALDRVMGGGGDERSPAPGPRPKGSRGTASSILMAAMLGLADGLGFERPKDETVEVADAPSDDNSLQLDFKHLPPLDQ